jgi:hypothetical protein
MEFSDPFDTYYRSDPDFNPADRLQEAADLIQRQEALNLVIQGKELPDYYLDLLESQGFDPVVYVNAVVMNVDTAIARRVLITPSPNLLILP